MVQDSKKISDTTISNVTFIGKNLNIYRSLRNLSSKLNSFSIDKANYSNNLIKNNGLLIVDDSIDNFNEKILYFKKKNYNNFFLLIEKENIKILKEKEYKIFFKPLKVFELHKEISKKISKNIQVTKGWKLDRSKLQFYKSNNSFINLTEKEFYFLFFLLQNKGNTVSKEKLLHEVWNFNIKNNNSFFESRVVETIVSKIRKKFNQYNKGPKLIKEKTGYKILV